MRKVIPFVTLLAILALAVVPVTAAPRTEAKCVDPIMGVPWGAISPNIQPMGFPFFCCRCRVCVNPVLWYSYTNCNCGYFDGCSGGYPSCNRPFHFTLYKTCDCP